MLGGDSRDLVYRVEDGLLEAVAESTDGLNGLANLHSHLLVVQSLVVGDIVRQFPVGGRGEEDYEVNQPVSSSALLHHK